MRDLEDGDGDDSDEKYDDLRMTMLRRFPSIMRRE